jgi:carbon storage regulator CsrA
VIGGTVAVLVVAVQGDRVRLGIDAPKNVRVDREEVHVLRTGRPLVVCGEERA